MVPDGFETDVGRLSHGTVTCLSREFSRVLFIYVLISFNLDVFVRNWAMFLIGHLDMSYGTFIGKGIYFCLNL